MNQSSLIENMKPGLDKMKQQRELGIYSYQNYGLGPSNQSRDYELQQVDQKEEELIR